MADDPKASSKGIDLTREESTMFHPTSKKINNTCVFIICIGYPICIIERRIQSPNVYSPSFGCISYPKTSTKIQKKVSNSCCMNIVPNLTQRHLKKRKSVGSLKGTNFRKKTYG